MYQVKCYPEVWPLHVPLRLAGQRRSDITVIVVELEKNGIKVTGEAAPQARFAESEESVLAQIGSLLPQLQQGISRQELQTQLPAGAARNAIDSALWQWERAQSSTPAMSAMMNTARRIHIDTPEAMASSASALWQHGFDRLRIRLDEHLISERLIAIRAAVPEATLFVDAMESWSADGLATRCQLLADLEVQVLIQPLPVGKDAALSHFIHPLPIAADASCRSREQLPALQSCYDMVVITLDKAGGLTEALALAEAAHQQGLKVLAGCSLGTSRAMRAALPLAQVADEIDLDGASWLAADCEPAVTVRDGKVYF
ncbi:L-Ala-D/L-Glu epimerase [Pantoea sp. A4]|uniref:L-Ala-D/L-Glu epimerase n=1 Tax=Pantoea sp. A4 TaxID=1225184 RepID=UPI000376B21D|nr:L-Ala-D/L-Glu epimerase [Pantoea sp. A4]